MNLLPTKHTHPDKTIIAVATILIKRLKKSRIEHFDSLLDFLNKKNTEFKALFMSAMNFLFVMGLIRYHKKTDSFEYTGS